MAQTAAEYRNSANRKDVMRGVRSRNALNRVNAQRSAEANDRRARKAYNDLFHYPAGELRKVRNETTGEVSYGSKRYEAATATTGMRASNRKRNYGA